VLSGAEAARLERLLAEATAELAALRARNAVLEADLATARADLEVRGKGCQGRCHLF
jgi:hypothetical protein